jgi:hypothetical protein
VTRNLDMRLNRLEAKFQYVPEGSLSSMAPGLPPLSREQVRRVLKDVDGRTRGIPKALNREPIAPPEGRST